MKTIKKFLLPVILSILCCGCSTTKNKYLKILDEHPSASGTEQNNEETLVKPPIVENLTWNDFKLFSIILNKDKKPQNSFDYVLQPAEEISPFKNGPKIDISEFSVNNDFKGRIVHISCPKVDIKQKFNTVEQTSGWAIEVMCNNNHYFFLINPAIKNK